MLSSQINKYPLMSIMKFEYSKLKRKQTNKKKKKKKKKKNSLKFRRIQQLFLLKNYFTIFFK